MYSRIRVEFDSIARPIAIGYLPAEPSCELSREKRTVNGDEYGKKAKEDWSIEMDGQITKYIVVMATMEKEIAFINGRDTST